MIEMRALSCLDSGEQPFHTEVQFAFVFAGS